MFFVASKIVGFLFQPFDLLLLAGLVGSTLCLTRLARVGRTLLVTAMLLLVVLAYSPISALVLLPLEDRFPRLAEDAPAPTGIIVLGGALDEDVSRARGEPTITEAAARLTSGAALARKYPGARLVFTGGTGNLRGGADEAEGVHALWLSLGVPAGQMTFENRSRNTWENAVFTRDIVHPKPGERWLLVTSAAHMPRSVGIFRKVGWPVIAAPVDYRTFGDRRDLKPTTLALDSWRRIEVAWHEWTGLLVYRLTGKTSTLFPKP